MVKPMWMRNVTEDEGISDNERTMTLIKQIGNDIHPSIQLVVGYPSKHQDRKLPILDLKVWIEAKENRKGNRGMIQESLSDHE